MQQSAALLSEPAALTPEQSSRVHAALAGLSAPQLQWVSGYAQGLAAGRTALAEDGAQAVTGPAAVVAPLAAAPREQAVLHILFGSQTGNGRALATGLEAEARAAGLAVKLQSLGELRTAELKRLRHAVFVVSTHGDGEPPDDALEFHEHVMGARAPRLPALKYAVLALGDSSYAQFCQTGRELDERLAALGATRLVARVECDVDYETPAAAWRAAVLDIARRELGSEVPAGNPPQLRALPVTPRYSRAHPGRAELVANQRITGRGSSKDVRHIELALGDGALRYEPGDALGVVVRNDPALVEEILALLALDGEQPVATPAGERALRDALVCDYEITTASRGFVEAWAALGDHAELGARLAPAERDTCARWLAGRQLADILHASPARVDAAGFLATLRGLKPRLYSIASSLAANPDEVHLTVGVVDFTVDGHRRQGVASSYLAERAGDTLEVYVETNPRFRLPVDDDVPIVMVGPGTGVAPFRAFLQERAARGARGRNWLVFGDRTFRDDFLYQLEWLRYRESGLLTRLDVAFSRDQANKVYVQDRLREAGAELYAWLEEGAHFYVCGDASRMAGDVDTTLGEVIATHGGLSAERAGEYVARLRRDGRYLRDVY
ncbi:MAG: assimilatory sulfite reductase (NADPH) flavoprotein subunit [Gammaproteobacteria bacterium]